MSGRRLVPGIIGVVALGLLPWTLWLSMTLPSRHLAEHWDVAWGGFDVLLSATLIATAFALVRMHRFAQGASTAAGALLVADAWFDVTTARAGHDLTMALVLAFVAELPLAGLCFWIAYDTDRFYAATTWLRRPAVEESAAGDLGRN